MNFFLDTKTTVAKTFYGGMGMDNERLEGDFKKNNFVKRNKK